MFRHLKGNILVDDDGQPCIADIGVDTLAVRAMSGVRDQRTDVYSFACVIYAVSGFLDLPC
ncbi:hypothetical protein PILCRDRAFT_826607, partial [Piloderma croceum F 1598]